MKRGLLSYIVMFSIAILFLILQSDQTEGCYYDGYENYFFDGIFESSIIKEPNLEPFFLPGYFKEDKNSSLSQTHDNLDEWFDYFKGQATREDIEKVVYKSSLLELSKIQEGMNFRNLMLNDQIWWFNSLINYLVVNQDEETLNYLIYAKECEPNVVANNENQWHELVRDSLRMDELIKSGKQLYSECNSEFLKLRYAYQIIRLAHYSHNYQKALECYKTMVEPSQVKSIIIYWAMSHEAGVLLRTGKESEGTYLFSRVYDECPSRRIIAAQNFSINSFSQLYEVLSHCKNNHEKVTVWFLNAIENSDYRSMKRIYSYEPPSPYLEVLLSRAIDEIEDKKIPWDMGFYYGDIQDEFLNLESGELYNFIYKCAQNRNTKRPYFWYYCAGYVALLSQDFENVKKNFSKVLELIPQEENQYKDRVKILQVLAQVEEQKQIDKKFEAKLLDQLKWLRDFHNYRSDDLYVYLMERLARKYINQGDTAKAYLCYGHKPAKYGWGVPVEQLDFESFRTSECVDATYNLMNSKKHSEFEIFLIENFKYSKSQIIEMQGTMLLRNYRFKDAISKFKEDESKLKPLPADPFIIHINDCQICDRKAPKLNFYTKLSFAEKMLELEKLVRKDSLNPDYYFQLANGYYNLTFFGNSWMILDYYRVRSNVGGDLTNNFYDLSKALENYEKVMKITKIKETAARACFMASKCEQNKFYFDAGYYDSDDYINTWVSREKYRKYFALLAENYSKTKFYKEAIKECKYFNDFVKLNY
jgi:hypothetical protein